jgi:hypothetical protein
MGIAAEYSEDDDLLVIVWDGHVTWDDWEAFALQRQAEEPAAPRGRRQLADITSARLDMAASDGEKGAGLIRDRRHLVAGTRLAIVAAAGWHHAKAYQRSLDEFGSTTIVFNELRGACTWLRVDRAIADTRIRRLRDELRAQPQGQHATS